MKKQLIAASVATVIGVTGLGAGVAHAATSSEENDGPMSSLVGAIATKFNLDKSEVQQVFDEQRETIEKEREANKDSMKDLSRDERKAKMEERKTALEAWAKEQGISTDYLHYVMGHGRGGHGGPGMGPKQADS